MKIFASPKRPSSPSENTALSRISKLLDITAGKPFMKRIARIMNVREGDDGDEITIFNISLHP